VQAQKNDPNAARQYATKAIAELDVALSIFNNIPVGHIHKGNMYLILAEYDKAIESFKTALTMDAGNYFAMSSLGNAYYRSANYQSCVEILERIGPNYLRPSDYYALSLCYEQLGNPQKSQENRQRSGR
jgi:tetratricopeptide (TPR) repeat protein